MEVPVPVRTVRVPLVRGPERTAYGPLVRYLEAGEGAPTVVLVHGSGVAGSGELAWRSIVELVSRQVRVLAPDLIWSGWSDVPAMPYSLEAQADQLAALLDVLDIQRCAVVGQSMGAYVAARFACDHPARVSHLFLVASNTLSKAMGLDIGASSPGRRAKEEFDGTRDALVRQMRTVLHHHELITDDELDERLAIAARPGMAEARVSMFEYVKRLDTDPNTAQSFSLAGRLARLTTPMALVWGVQDQFAPVELGRRLRELLPLDAYEEIDEASHSVFRDQPERFTKLLVEFVTR